ncbi:MAG: hypothetical protein HGA79_02870 [Anaerolineales bacterium]|nr:hypothetical protein [Anaerolineales bacterium]
MKEPKSVCLVLSLFILSFLLPVSLGACDIRRAESPPPLTVEMLKNAEYPSEWTEKDLVTLKDGEYREEYESEGMHLTNRMWLKVHALGDLNDDGAEDAAVILLSTSGGSGGLVTLVAVLNDGGKPRSVDAASLGMKTAVKSMTIESGEITLKVLTQGPNDPNCCPTVEETLEYELQGDTLVATRLPPSPGMETESPTPTRTSSSGPMMTPLPPSQTSLLIPGGQVDYQGVQFTLPTGLANGVSAQVVTAEKGMEELYPTHIEFKLVNYPSQNAQHEPRITVYSTVDLGEYSEYLNTLAQLLEEQPSILQSELHIVQYQHAGQLVDAQIQYLKFKNGSGVRVLTQFAQNTAPINNVGLVYVFEGLTNNGDRHVLVFLPVAAPFLSGAMDDPSEIPPVDGHPFPLWDSPDFFNEYTNYRKAVTQKLNATPAQAFTPDLSELDSLIESLFIGPR